MPPSVSSDSAGDRVPVRGVQRAMAEAMAHRFRLPVADILAIGARPGTWTLPAGFMEAGETTEQAALREVWEESGVRAEIVSPYSIFSVPKISEVYIIFRAIALEITGQFGPETLDYKFFAPEDIPWDSIYYPAIRQILERYIAERQAGVYGIYIGNDDSGKVHFIR